MHSSRRRRVKIIATLGPASADRETIAALFAAGADVFRINMSHASHDGMRERVAMIRSLEEEIGRPIGILVDLQGPKLRLGAFPDGGADLHRGDAFVLDSDPSPGGSNARLSAASGNPEFARARPSGPDRRRQGASARCRRVAWTRVDRRRGGGTGIEQEGRQPPRHDDPDLGDDRQGSRRPRRGARGKHRLDRPLVRAASGGHRRGQDDRQRPRAGDGQDREAAGRAAARRDHGGGRRPDGGARRSRRRNAAGASARHPEDVDPPGAPARQACGGGDADAEIDDHRAGADARRSVRRRDRGVRGRGRGHAVGRKRLGPISARGGGDDEPDRRGGGIGGDLSLDHRGAARSARGDRRRRDRRGDARRRRNAAT